MANHSRTESPLSLEIGSALHLEQRYLQGLRFAGTWEYPVALPSGRRRWQTLPLLEASPARTADPDPQGAWWCIRRCAAVMGQQSWRLLRTAKQCSPQPEAAQVVQALQELLPNCLVHAPSFPSELPMAHIARLLHHGGCALLQLGFMPRIGNTATVYWAWVVGVETCRVVAPSEDQIITTETLQALLVVGQRWSAPWGSGFGAKLQRGNIERCMLCSVDGQRLQGSCTAVVAVAPVTA